MNVFNRIVMVLSILAWLALAVILLILPLDVINVARLGLEELERIVLNDQAYLYFAGVCAVLLLVLLILLWLELRRPHYRTIQIRTKGKGDAQLGVESVAHSLEYRIDELAGVRKVHPQIVSRGRQALVTLNLETSPSVNIPALTDQIVELTHDIVENQLGLKIQGRVRVNVKHEPYPRGTMPVAGPKGKEPVQPPTIHETPVVPRSTGPDAPQSEKEREAPPSAPQEREGAAAPSHGAPVPPPAGEEDADDEDQNEEQEREIDW